MADPPQPLEIYSGNPTHSREKWKIRFEIYLQATGTSANPDAQKWAFFLIASPSAGNLQKFLFRSQRIQAPNGLLKLYDQGADLSLEKAIQILSQKKTYRLELQELKSATIDAFGSKRCRYCNLEHPPGTTFCPADEHTCEKRRKTMHYAFVSRSSRRAQVNQVNHTNLPQHQPTNPVLGSTPSFIGSIANETRKEKETLES